MTFYKVALLDVQQSLGCRMNGFLCGLFVCLCSLLMSEFSFSAARLQDLKLSTAIRHHDILWSPRKC